MKKYFTKEMSIGLVAIISGIVLYVGINYLKGANVFKPTNHYHVRMPNVNELQKSSPVYVDGFRVGLVNAIEYEYDSNSEIVVQISLDKKMKVETGSYFELKSGLTSGAYLNLVINKYVSTYCQIGDTLEGVSNPGMMDKISTDIFPKLEAILPRLDTILLGIQLLVNHPALVQSLEQISATTANLEKSTQQLNTILSKDITPILSNLNHVSSDFTVVSQNLKQLDLDKTFGLVNQTMQNVDQLTLQLNRKDNSLGLLLNDRSLYDTLDSVFVNTSDLLIDLRQNPKRYVHFSIFGKK
jgi:phospholipid/cholesterol/gamma-HCH transport system substrate-binding protein